MQAESRAGAREQVPRRVAGRKLPGGSSRANQFGGTVRDEHALESQVARSR